MRCIIIDDEITARKIISHLCSRTKSLKVVGGFSDGVSAIEFLSENQVDLIFLDIHLPQYTGFDFIKALNTGPKVVLTTSDKNFALKAFEYDCIVDYLLKPITYPRFLKAIQKVRTFISVVSNSQDFDENTTVPPASNNELYVSINKRLVKLEMDNILYIQADGDYIHIYTEDKILKVRSTLKKIKDKLPETTFMKTHRSYIVNISKIKDIVDTSILIANYTIPISRNNKQPLMKRLNLL